MRSLIQQFDRKSWPILTGPVVFSFPRSCVGMHTESELASVCVPTQERGNEEHKTVIATGYKTARSRDGPLIFHMRDGPPNVTGPPGGAGSPRFMSESDPPKTTDQPLEWLVRKKCLKKALKNSLEK